MRFTVTDAGAFIPPYGGSWSIGRYVGLLVGNCRGGSVRFPAAGLVRIITQS